MDFSRLLNKHAIERPASIALHDDGRPVSYGELWQEARRMAALLYARGARPGDRMALWLPNCTAWLVIFLACARLGVTVVALNTRFRSREVGDIVSRSRSRWMAVWPTFKGLPFAEILQEVPAQELNAVEQVLVLGDLPATPLVPGAEHFSYLEEAVRGTSCPPEMERGSDLALVYTTSGTTSRSKLVVHDQETLIAHGESVAAVQGIGETDAILMGAPFCGAFGFSAAVAGLAAGGALVSAPVLDATECARQIQRFNVTHTFANNELLDQILAAGQVLGYDFPSLRVAGFASFSPSLGDLPQRAERAGIAMIGLYGSSELQALVAAQDRSASLEARQQPGGCLADPRARVRARDMETGKILPYGELGEIEICSPSLMRGYLDDDMATRQAVDVDGYFRTGDLGHTVNERAFVFHARKGDYLRLSGFLVNPVEIERFIEEQEGVAACQVVGATHGGRSVPVAFIVAQPGCSVDELAVLAACKASLARFKVPHRAAAIDTFPVVESANSNKIQRTRLQEMANALLAETG